MQTPTRIRVGGKDLCEKGRGGVRGGPGQDQDEEGTLGRSVQIRLSRWE